MTPVVPKSALVALFSLVLLWLVSLAGWPLLSADEGRYASLSLGMLHSGDWVTPRLNGLLYFEKPPLQYWAGAIAMALFGINDFAARFWPGLAGLFTVAMVGYTAAQLWGSRAGWQALAICGGCTWVVVNSHFLSLDAGLCACLTLVLCAVLLAERDPPQSTMARRRYVLAAWAGMALAVLSKGLVGLVIPGAVLVLHSLWRLDLAIWKRLHWSAGLALLLLIAAPWFVLVSARNPDFAQFFFIHEHLQRYLTKVHGRVGAWWYFVPVLLIGFMPWTSALPWLLVPRRRDFASSFLLVWVIFIFVFFSVSDSKLTSYILPLFPALALLLAQRLQSTSVTALRRHLAIPAVLWLVVLLASPWLNGWIGESTTPTAAAALSQGIVIASVLGLAGCAVAAWALRGGRLTLAVAGLAVSQMLGVLTIMATHAPYGQYKTAVAIAPVLLPHLQSQDPIFAVADYDQTLPFYLRRNVTLVAYQDEFAFGQGIEPDRWIPTLEGFLTRWQASPRAAAYMASATFASLRQRGLPMQVVYQDAQRVVVIKPTADQH